jgi:hypothetical protein
MTKIEKLERRHDEAYHAMEMCRIDIEGREGKLRIHREELRWLESRYKAIKQALERAELARELGEEEDQ